MKQLKSLVATSTKSRSLSACAAIAPIVTQLSPPAKPAGGPTDCPSTPGPGATLRHHGDSESQA